MRVAALLVVILSSSACLSIAGRRPDPLDPQHRPCSPRWTAPADVGLGLLLLTGGVLLVATAPTDGYYIATPAGMGKAGMFMVVGGFSYAATGAILWATGGPDSSIFRTCSRASLAERR